MADVAVVLGNIEPAAKGWVEGRKGPGSRSPVGLNEVHGFGNLQVGLGRHGEQDCLNGHWLDVGANACLDIVHQQASGMVPVDFLLAGIDGSLESKDAESGNANQHSVIGVLGHATVKPEGNRPARTVKQSRGEKHGMLAALKTIGSGEAVTGGGDTEGSANASTNATIERRNRARGILELLKIPIGKYLLDDDRTSIVVALKCLDFINKGVEAGRKTGYVRIGRNIVRQVGRSIILDTFAAGEAWVALVGLDADEGGNEITTLEVRDDAPVLETPDATAVSDVDVGEGLKG